MGQNIPQAAKDAELQRQEGLAQQTAPTTGTDLTASTPTSTVQDQIAQSAKGYTQAGNILTNPNQSNQFGNQTTTVDPITGQPTVNSTLSPGDASALKGIQDTSTQASGSAQGFLGGQYQNLLSSAGPQNGPSQALQSAIYGNLTQGYDQQEAQDYQNFDQSMANRGIPVGSNAYNNAKNQLDLSWQQKTQGAQNTALTDAYGQATTQQNANTSSLNAGTSALGAMSNAGQAGYVNPNFQGFSSVAYQQPDVQGLYNTGVASSLTQQQIQEQLQAAQLAAQTAASNAKLQSQTSIQNTGSTNATTLQGDTILAGTKPQTSGFTTNPPGA